MPSEPTNATRAENAYRTLLVFRQYSPAAPAPDGDQVETMIYDLICDLHHLADEYGADWAHIERMALMHYETELAEEG